MKRQILFCALIWAASQTFAQQATVSGPDSRLKVDFSVSQGIPMYAVTYNEKTILEKSPLGFIANIGDFSKDMSYVGQKVQQIKKTYTQDRIKRSVVNYTANELTVSLQNADKAPVDIVFRVSNNDIAFRYEIPKSGETGSIVIREEKTGFDFPAQTTTFLCPQSDAMIGWKRTKPSYEEEYTADAPMNVRSQYGHGYTFPGLFRIGNDGWALISETGVDSKYCGSHLRQSETDSGNNRPMGCSGASLRDRARLPLRTRHVELDSLAGQQHQLRRPGALYRPCICNGIRICADRQLVGYENRQGTHRGTGQICTQQKRFPLFMVQLKRLLE